jgi:hypothetical protein
MQAGQALNIIKQALDASIKAGVVQNMEQASAILQAYTVIQNTISKPNDTGAN